MITANSEGSSINERIHRVISAVLVALMMASAGLAFSQVASQIAPEYRGGYLPLVCLLVAVERFYTYRIFTKLAPMTREWVVFLSTEWIVILILIKLTVSLSDGAKAFLAEIPTWQLAFAENFLTPGFVIAAVIAGLTWFVVGIIADLLDEMGMNSALVARETMPGTGENQSPPRQRLMATVFGLGGILMFMTSVARVDFRSFFANQTDLMYRSLPPLAAGGAGTLLYFMFALALLSQAHYITLNTRWFLQGVPVSRKLATQWVLSSVVFLVAVALVASVLPTNYSLGLLSMLGYLLDILMAFFILLFGLIYAIIGFLVSIPLMLFGSGPTGESILPTQPQVFEPPPTIPVETTPIPWLDLLKSVVFWGIFLAVVGYSIAQYLRQHDDVFASLKKIPGSRWVLSFFKWVASLFKGFNRGFSRAMQRGRNRLRTNQERVKANIGSRFVSLRRLSPRERVFFYYQALLRRGNETGLPRKAPQTPEEYAKLLERSLPTARGEIDGLTEAFSEARYSDHAVEDDTVEEVKGYWGIIRKIFRGRRG